MQNVLMMIDHESVLARVRKHYENSSDFNGLPIQSLDMGGADLVGAIVDLIRREEIDLVRGDGHPNPHIKAFPADPIDVQVQKIDKQGLGSGCLYPTRKHLSRFGSRCSEDAPFTRELELGAPQLDFRVFDLRVLEWYRNDPRFYYEIDDIHGQIGQRSGTRAADGQIVQDDLEFFEFGFAYNDDLERAIAAFLRYLHDLPGDQQRYLAGYQLQGTFNLHPDFYRTQIIGQFPERISIYDAFLEEKHIVNEMCALMAKPPLFRTDNEAYSRPSGFGILIRPTKKEFGDFALLLDQLLSDDLNRDFFKGDIPVSETLTRDDGSTFTQSIGTIVLLENWLRKHFRPSEPEAMDELLKGLRTVRKARQKPAHQVDDNEFDQAYLKDQRELIITAFKTARTVRIFFENHPSVRGYDVPDWLREGKVWTR